MKENNYYLNKTLSYFNQIDFLRNYSQYSLNLQFEYHQYERSIYNNTDIEHHKKFEHFLEKFLTAIYKTAYIDKNKCDYDILNSIEFYS